MGAGREGTDGPRCGALSASWFAAVVGVVGPGERLEEMLV